MTVDREACKRKNLRNKYPLVESEHNSVQAQSRQSLTAGTELLLLRQEREGRGRSEGRSVNAVSVVPPTPQKPRTMQHYSG